MKPPKLTFYQKIKGYKVIQQGLGFIIIDRKNRVCKWVTCTGIELIQKVGHKRPTLLP